MSKLEIRNQCNGIQPSSYSTKSTHTLFSTEGLDPKMRGRRIVYELDGIWFSSHVHYCNNRQFVEFDGLYHREHSFLLFNSAALYEIAREHSHDVRSIT